MSHPDTRVDLPPRPARGPALDLPGRDGVLRRHVMSAPRDFGRTVAAPPHCRVFYAAPHVVLDPLSEAPRVRDRIDWEATLAYRRHLWALGLGVAEAMDTAQRGMGLDWDATQRLIELSVAEAGMCGGRVACGAATDQLLDGSLPALSDIERAYVEQCELIEGLGATPIVMASRALAAVAAGRADAYLRVYRTVLAGVSGPAILHWLGEAFDPLLAGYWGGTTLDHAEDALLQIVHEHADRVDGIKLSVLEPEREIALRRRLPAGVRLYTGDDHAYDVLIRGDEHGHSDALLGAFNVIAPAAAAALTALDDGDLERYDAIMAPTVPLSRTIFEAPTQYYKTGVVLVAYLNGHQAHFRMLGGLESARSVLHLADVFRLADRAGILRDPELAAARMRHVLALGGVAT